MTGHHLSSCMCSECRMSNPPTQSRAVPDEEPTLDEIKARRAAVTPSRWEHYVGNERTNLIAMTGYIAKCGSDGIDTHYVVPGERGTYRPHGAVADAEFIASAPSDIDALFAEIARLRSESEAVKAEGAIAIEAMIKSLHESSSDYEAALESARSESEALRREKEQWREAAETTLACFEAKIARSEEALKALDRALDDAGALNANRSARHEAQLAAIQSWRLSADLTPGQDAALMMLASRSSSPSSVVKDVSSGDLRRSTLGIEGTNT